eukprot:CCRYP_001038-RA/>CCRYP_001038-RA protein AED:0.25 eAED:0.25 QI:0/-1/0/1/-1/1/1/0/190
MGRQESRNSELIVDFPLQQRLTRTDSNKAQRKKYVSFSKLSTAIDIDNPTTEENAAKWYSRDEETHFRNQVPRDATVCSMMWMRDVKNEVPYEVLIRCLGVDHLLSKDVPQRYREFKSARKMHVHTVLNEQDQQRERNECSMDELAYVSEESSKRARARAHKAAKFFMMADSTSQSAVYTFEISRDGVPC